MSTLVLVLGALAVFTVAAFAAACWALRSLDDTHWRRGTRIGVGLLLLTMGNLAVIGLVARMFPEEGLDAQFAVFTWIVVLATPTTWSALVLIASGILGRLPLSSADARFGADARVRTAAAAVIALSPAFVVQLAAAAAAG